MKPFVKPPDGFVIHHSKTLDGPTVSWSAIRYFHTHDPAHMWDDIGYGFGVELAGTEYEALVGRPMDMQGAHCPQDGMNSHTIGICLIGDFDGTPPPQEQMMVLRDRLLVPIGRVLGIPLNLQTITFHRDHARDGRTCPGTMFTKELLTQYLPK